jgi:hypothetical protein
MGDIVNLRSIRKRIQRDARAQRAAGNRVKNGISKSARVQIQASVVNACRYLDGHRIEARAVQ